MAKNGSGGSGCLIVFVTIGVLGGLAAWAHWTYGWVVLLIPAWMLVSAYRAHAEGQVDREALREIFRPTGLLPPVLRHGARYGYPAFTLIFPSQGDLDAASASGCIAAFKAFLQSRYADVSFQGSRFDAELAVYAVCEPASEA